MAKPSTVASVKVNFVMNFLLTLSNFIFPLVTYPYAARILLPEGIGRVAFATSIITYFTMLAMLGIPTYGIRVCARVREDKEQLSRTVQELLLINLLMMLFSLALYLFAIFTVPKLTADYRLFLLNTIILVLNVVGCDWLYKGLEQYNYITKQSILFKALAIVLMFIFVKDQSDYLNYAAITAFASVGSYVVNFLRLRKFISFQPLKILSIKRHFKPTLTFFMMSIATVVYTSLDAVMLGFMVSDTEVGYYSTAMNIKNVFVSLVTSLGVVLLPRLSVYISQNQMSKFKQLTYKALTFVVFSSVPLILFFVVFAQTAVYFLSDSSFEGSIIPLQISLPTILLIGLSNLFGIQMLVPMDREEVVVKSVTVGAVINLLLNSLLIPYYGATGAAIGTVVAELFVTLYQAFSLRDVLVEQVRKLEVFKFFTAALLALLPVISLSNRLEIASYFIQLVIFSALYAVLYIGLLIIFREQLVSQFVKSFSHRRK